MARKPKPKRKSWTVAEIQTLEKHASEGIEALKKLIPGHSEASIRKTASRYGISIVRRWWCPNCSRWVFEPLKPSTGWCRECAKQETLTRNQLESRNLRLLSLGKQPNEEAVEALDREIAKTYQETSRLKKSQKIMSLPSHTGDDLRKRKRKPNSTS